MNMPTEHDGCSSCGDSDGSMEITVSNKSSCSDTVGKSSLFSTGHTDESSPYREASGTGSRIASGRSRSYPDELASQRHSPTDNTDLLSSHDDAFSIVDYWQDDPQTSREHSVADVPHQFKQSSSSTRQLRQTSRQPSAADVECSRRNNEDSESESSCSCSSDVRDNVSEDHEDIMAEADTPDVMQFPITIQNACSCQSVTSTNRDGEHIKQHKQSASRTQEKAQIKAQNQSASRSRDKAVKLQNKPARSSGISLDAQLRDSAAECKSRSSCQSGLVKGMRARYSVSESANPKTISSRLQHNHALSDTPTTAACSSSWPSARIKAKNSVRPVRNKLMKSAQMKSTDCDDCWPPISTTYYDDCHGCPHCLDYAWCRGCNSIHSRQGFDVLRQRPSVMATICQHELDCLCPPPRYYPDCLALACCDVTNTGDDATTVSNNYRYSTADVISYVIVVLLIGVLLVAICFELAFASFSRRL